MSNAKLFKILGAAIAVLLVAIMAIQLAPALPNPFANTSGSEEATGSEQAGSDEATSSETSGSDEAATDTAEAVDPYEGATLHHAEIDVKDFGTIAVELNETVAPESVANFLRLANEGFYDRTTFHRIISGFMIQGGADLTGTQPTITGEFASNGHENPISHVRGTISMARATDPDSASTQFFIVHADSTYLDGEYAAFGRVTDGMDVVDAIAENTAVQDDNGTVADADQPIIETVRVID